MAREDDDDQIYANRTNDPTTSPEAEWDREWDAMQGWRWTQRTPTQDPGAMNYWRWMGYAPDGSRGKTNDYGWQSALRASSRPEPTTTPPNTNTNTNTVPPPVGPGPRNGPSNLSTTGDPSDAFAWPTFNAPTYTPGPAFQAPEPFSYDAFSYDAFQGPEFSDIYKDGSYKGRRDEGLQAIEHGAAAKGLSRLPQTLKALSGWNQDFASREYGNIWDRSANTYDRNRGNAYGNWQANRNNAADAYSLNYGVSRDAWDRGEQQNLSAFDRKYTGARDQFDFNEFQPAKMTFDDLYRRWKSELDANTAIATAGAGD